MICSGMNWPPGEGMNWPLYEVTHDCDFDGMSLSHDGVKSGQAH